MKRICLFFFVSFTFSLNLSAQFSKYIVKFKNKNGTPFSINDPSKFLSQRAIERRTKQHISIDETDLPVTPSYVDSVRLAGSVKILDQSKWLNQICIETTDSTALSKINRFSFVIKTQPLERHAFAERNQFDEQVRKDKFNEQLSHIAAPLSVTDDHYSYGHSFSQIHIHHGEYLHNKGFHGEGMLIAVIDAGFYHYKTLPAFDSVNIKGLVVETYDFVNNEESVNEDNEHGMMCFSIIAANIPGQFIGTSPNAHFLLYRSEDASSESPVEEQYWVAAAERADSAGTDIITTSLGYNLFDNPVFNYTYADMNGHTSIIAKAATIAARKGMIVLAAAGNEGDDSWHFISTPGDADSILTVGAVDASGNVAAFSSYGPSSDGRVKPTSASVGFGTVVSSPTGGLLSGNGTSFATPDLAGLVTCLWQAFPEFTNMEIIEAVEKSSSIYQNPDNRIGYGIPDFEKAFDDLSQQRILKNAATILGNRSMKIFPNPFKDQFTVLIKPGNTSTGTFELYDAGGKLYFQKRVPLQKDVIQLIHFGQIQPLQRGLYVLKFSDRTSAESFKLMVD